MDDWQDGSQLAKRVNALIIVAGLLLILAVPAKAKEFKVRDFGAKGNGRTLDTKAINRAIAAAAAAGGGIVTFDKAKYLTGSIHLKSRVDLKLKRGAIIQGASNKVGAYDQAEPNKWHKYQDFGHSHFRNALMWGEGVEDVSIYGEGAIHGGGMTASNRVPRGGGDKSISLKQCKNIRIHGISIHRGGHFAILMNGCEKIDIRNLTIRTQRDGINVISSRQVTIEGCDIEAVRWQSLRKVGGDDAIAFKSDYALGKRLPVENVRVRNCRLSSGTNGIQFGSETVGDFRDVIVEDCMVMDAGKAGIGITSNDGGVVSNVRFKNIVIMKAANGIYMNVSDRLRTPEKAKVGTITNVTLENITVVDATSYINKRTFTSTISGRPGHPLSNIVLKNIRIRSKGGGTADMANRRPKYGVYKPRSLGRRPAHGLYVRWVKGFSLVNASFDVENPDLRPALVFERVENAHLRRVVIDRGKRKYDVQMRKVKGFNLKESPRLRVETRD